MRDTDLAWVAGILEGEGSFCVCNNKTPTVSTVMYDEDIMVKLNNLIQGNFLKFNDRKRGLSFYNQSKVASQTVSRIVVSING